MSALPIATVYKPSTLSGTANGQLPDSLLRTVGPSGKLHYLAAQAFLALVSAAARAGIPLTYTYGGTYRTFAQQTTLFKQRYQTKYDPKVTSTAYKTWNGEKWYQKLGVAEAATPGNSNHGWGLAIDTALDRDPSNGVSPDDAVSIMPAMGWMLANAPRFGFSWELQSEPWHIRYCSGDVPPEAVMAEGQAPTVQPVSERPTPLVFDPVHGLYALWPFASKPVTFEGAKGDVVKYLQGVLRNKANNPDLVVDGQFGRKTDAAVRKLQAFIVPPVDGRVGSKTWGVIDLLATS